MTLPLRLQSHLEFADANVPARFTRFSLSVPKSKGTVRRMLRTVPFNVSNQSTHLDFPVFRHDGFRVEFQLFPAVEP